MGNFNYIKRIGIFLLMMISLFYLIPRNKNEKCSWQLAFEKTAFEGVVKRKIIDSSQHSTPIIEIKNNKMILTDTIDLFGDESNVFSLINKGDTLYKRSKSPTIYVYRNGKLKVVGKVNFGCK